TGQLLIKCAAFFQRQGDAYRLLATVGARDARLSDLEIPADLPQIVALFRDRTVLDLDLQGEGADPTLARLRRHGFHGLFSLSDGPEPLALIALGEKIVPSP